VSVPEEDSFVAGLAPQLQRVGREHENPGPGDELVDGAVGFLDEVRVADTDLTFDPSYNQLI
jgi:hypothetical protein